MKKLDGKVALVTGGTSGIGLATAKLFVSEGAHVYVTGRKQEKLDAAVKLLGENSTRVQADAANMNDLDRLFQKVSDNSGKLDVIFANAGITEFAPFGRVDEEHFDRLFNNNVKGLLFTVQKALPLLSDGGSVILTSSVAEIKGMPGTTVYAATKAALRSFARTWTTDLKERKIRVNVVSPGAIDTQGSRELLGNTPEALKRKERIMQLAPAARLGEAEEIAKAVLFLASDDSSYVTGIELFVDGGMGQV